MDISEPARIDTRSRGSVAGGEALPVLAVDVTTTLIVSGAIASRDFHVLHHDPVAARELGSRDIIMNIMTTTGLVGRFITDWAGPDALIERVGLRLGAPNHPGDTMHLHGEVTATTRDGLVTIAYHGDNSIGIHVHGTADVQLPE